MADVYDSKMKSLSLRKMSDVADSLSGVSTEHFFTAEQLQKDIDYYRAQRIITRMFDEGCISRSQFDQLTDLNVKTFSPYLSEIFPKRVEKNKK